jgi:hypothetical protein
MQKSSKKFIGIVAGIAVGIPFIALLIFVLINSYDYKGYVFDYVNENKAALEQVAARLSASGENAREDFDGHTVNYWHNAKKTEFSMYVKGMVTSGTYGGFYYSPQDKPLGFQGAPAAFTEQPDGTFTCERSDNTEYTERITENWFWYEAKF